MYISTLPAALKRARTAAGLTQAELAEATGLGLKTIMNAEQGKPTSLYTINKLREYYDCDLDYLTGRIDAKTHDIQFICDQTGLSEDLVLKLQELNRPGNHTAEYLSAIVTHPRFAFLVSWIDDLRTSRAEENRILSEEGLDPDFLDRTEDGVPQKEFLLPTLVKYERLVQRERLDLISRLFETIIKKEFLEDPDAE